MTPLTLVIVNSTWSLLITWRLFGARASAAIMLTDGNVRGLIDMCFGNLQESGTSCPLSSLAKI